MEQTDLFPKAQRIVTELSSYAGEIIKEMEKLDDAIDKKKGEFKVLEERLVEIRKAIGDAQSFAAALAPEEKPGGEIVEFHEEQEETNPGFEEKAEGDA